MPHAFLFIYWSLINQATPDDLLDPMTALLSHPKWLVIIKEDLMLAVDSNHSSGLSRCLRSTSWLYQHQTSVAIFAFLMQSYAPLVP
jgi:hypothetical protein